MSDTPNSEYQKPKLVEYGDLDSITNGDAEGGDSDPFGGGSPV
jgi:hypothetical protein